MLLQTLKQCRKQNGISSYMILTESFMVMEIRSFKHDIIVAEEGRRGGGELIKRYFKVHPTIHTDL